MSSPELRPIIFDYRPSGLDIVFDGNLIAAIPHEPLYIKISEKSYRLERMEFHTPSEHKIEGEVYDGEIQLIHRNDDNEYMNLAIMLWEGPKHEAFQKLIERLPRKAGGRQSLSKLDFREILPKRKSYFRYSGSFTTPPCKEGVTWFVFTHGIQLSDFQLDQFEISHGKNNRPTQILGQRIPLESR